MRYAILIFVAVLVGCHASNSKNGSINTANKRADTTVEYLGAVKLNGVINFKDNIRKVESILGPLGRNGTQLSDQKDERGGFSKNKIDSNFKFQGISFQDYQDTIILMGIDFRKSPTAFLETAKLRLTSKTAFTELKKVFPVSSDNELSGTDMDKILAIAIEADKNSPGMWILYFDRNTEKLLEISYQASD